jgi:hypothetical protein
MCIQRHSGSKTSDETFQVMKKIFTATRRQQQTRFHLKTIHAELGQYCFKEQVVFKILSPKDVQMSVNNLKTLDSTFKLPLSPAINISGNT